MMNSILFMSVMNGGAWGGSEETWYQTALWMAGQNYQVSVCCFDWQEEAKSKRLVQLEKAGCTIYRMPGKKMSSKFLGKLKLARQLKSIPFEKFDFVLLNQGGWSDVLHAPFKKLYKRLRDYALYSHNYNINDRLSATKIKLYHSWINNASLNIGDAGRIFEVLHQVLNIDTPRRKVIYNPITFTVPKTAAPFPSLQQGNYIWVMLAELDTFRKAQDVIIKTFASEKWKSRNVQLHIYGIGQDEMMLKKLIEELGISQSVLMKGFSNNVQDVLQQCHSVLQITHIDAMPISVVEGMAVARPCIVSNVGDMPLWVTNKKNGWVSKAINEIEIDNVLELHWQQKDNWEAMGKNAFDTFVKKYPQPYEEKVADILSKYIS